MIGDIFEAAREWQRAMSIVAEMSIKHPEYSKCLNELSEAEDRLSRLVRLANGNTE